MSSNRNRDGFMMKPDAIYIVLRQMIASDVVLSSFEVRYEWLCGFSKNMIC